jgi:hypothetical protein
MPIPCCNITNGEALASLEKAKKTAVATIMKPLSKTKNPIRVANESGKPAPVQGRKKKKVLPVKKHKGSKTSQLPARIIQPNQTSLVEKSVKLCGCRHGDLNAFKSFTKAEVAYYTRPHKFLEGRNCLDCKCAVLKMQAVGHRQKSVLFYCDQGIKGFDAPEDDEMKGELTCDLVLCLQCETTRGSAFELEGTGRLGNRRNRSRG